MNLRGQVVNERGLNVQTWTNAFITLLQNDTKQLVWEQFQHTAESAFMQ